VRDRQGQTATTDFSGKGQRSAIHFFFREKAAHNRLADKPGPVRSRGRQSQHWRRYKRDFSGWERAGAAAAMRLADYRLHSGSSKTKAERPIQIWQKSGSRL
jgi:hypothetical protein